MAAVLISPALVPIARRRIAAAALKDAEKLQATRQKHREELERLLSRPQRVSYVDKQRYRGEVAEITEADCGERP